MRRGQGIALIWAMAFAALIAVTGCTSQPATEEASPGETPTVSPTTPQPTAVQTCPVGQPETPTPLPRPFEGAAVPDEAAEVVAMAMADLAERLGIEGKAIRVAALEAVQWRDASLGCPQPGMMYAQVITPGYKVVLEAGGEAYAYHTSMRHVVLCEVDTP